MSRPPVETDALARALWDCDWSGKPELGDEIWEALEPDLLPKRVYIAKAERLLREGWRRATSPEREMGPTQ